MSTAPKFVVSHLDQQLGPFDEAEIKAKWTKGELLPIDYVFDESKQDWVLLTDRFVWAVAAIRAADEGPPPVIGPPAKKAPQAFAMPPAVMPPAVMPPDQVAAQAKAAVEIRGANVMKEWKKPSSAVGAKVKLIDGVGEIDLSTLQPGLVELALQDSSSHLVKLHEPIRIQIKASHPTELTWTVPKQQTAGQDIEVQVRAVDSRGQVVETFSGEARLHIVGQTATSEQSVSLNLGRGATRLRNTKAEKWTLSLSCATDSSLRMPKEETLEWLPGPATRLILDGPTEYIAGQQLKVQVKAVDAFGNLAKTFQGTVILEVKAS